MKRFMSVIVCLVLCLSFFAGGCVVTESENVQTSGIWAHFWVEHDTDDTVYAYAVLRVGGQAGTIIDLVGSDQMYCNETRMVEYIEPITNFHWTRAKVDWDSLDLYEFEFAREDENVFTTVEVPDVPLISNPPPGVTVYPDEEIALMWDDLLPADYVNIFLNGGCIHNQADLDVEDDGDFTMAPIQDLDPQNPSDCALYLEIRRLLRGTVHSDFQGGYTEGKRFDGIDLYYEGL